MSAKPYVWALGALWGLPAVAVAVGYLLLDKDVPPSECASVMFGCVSDADGVLFLGAMGFFYVLIPAGVAAAAVIALIQVLRSRRGDPQSSEPVTASGAAEPNKTAALVACACALSLATGYLLATSGLVLSMVTGLPAVLLVGLLGSRNRRTNISMTKFRRVAAGVALSAPLGWLIGTGMFIAG